MRTIGKKRAIRRAFFRLGLHTTPKGVVDALKHQDVQVTEELIRKVRFQILKESTEARPAKASKPVQLPPVRRRPQGLPGR